MGEAGTFKTTTFGGFDKKSVLSYIDALNEQFHAAEADYAAKLEEYARAQDSQVAHIKKLEAQLADQEGKISELDTQNKALQKQLSDSERELQIQIERGRQLQFKAESLDYKSKKYDELSGQIGDAMIEAKRNADQIIAEANGKAAQITDQAHAYMRNFYSELGSFKGDAARLRKSIEEILFVLNDRIDVMQEVVRQVEKKFGDDTRLDYTEEQPPFSEPADEAGYLGGAVDEHLPD